VNPVVRRCVSEIFILLGYYVAYAGIQLPTFRDNLSVPSSIVKQSFLTMEVDTDRLSRNVANWLPVYDA
jgi:hypothetical protein